MPIVKLDTGFNIEVEFATAPLARRFLAWMIDLIIAWLITKGLAALMNTTSFFLTTDIQTAKGVVAALPAIFYHLICELTMQGQSPGKFAMRCRVVTQEGGQPTTGQYFTRWVFRLVDFPVWIIPAVIFNVIPWWTVPLLFGGLFTVFITPASQRVGDLIAGTILIDLRNNASWEDTLFTELSLDYQPRYPLVMQLSDRDLNTLKTIIVSVRKRKDHHLAERIANRIQTKLKMETTQDPADFLETLLMDYNYYTSR